MLIVKEVEIIDFQETPVICIQNTGPYKGGPDLFANLFSKLFHWAGDRGLISFPLTKMLTMYHDDPEKIPEMDQRISVCITIPNSAEAEGEMVKLGVAGGKYAVGRFEVAADEYGKAWSHMSDWLSENSGSYTPLMKPCFELYLNDPETHPEKRHVVDICIPVESL